jgi:cell shape-determining protein MreC
MDQSTSPMQAAINLIQSEMEKLAQAPDARCNEAVEKLKDYERLWISSIQRQAEMDQLLKSL